MANEALVAAVKNIVTLAKGGKSDEAYAAYGKLYASPEFRTYTETEQRQALKLMVMAKGMPQVPTPPIMAAHKCAIAPLLALVAAHKDPADFEMLGMCQAVSGDEKSARATFQAGLDLERARDPQSTMCGTLMKRVASV